MSEYIKEAYDYWMDRKDKYNIVGVEIYKFKDSDRYFKGRTAEDCEFLADAIKDLKPEDFKRKVLMAEYMYKDEYNHFTGNDDDYYFSFDEEHGKDSTILVIVLSNNVDEDANEVYSACGKWKHIKEYYDKKKKGKKKVKSEMLKNRKMVKAANNRTITIDEDLFIDMLWDRVNEVQNTMKWCNYSDAFWEDTFDYLSSTGWLKSDKNTPSYIIDNIAINGEIVDFDEVKDNYDIGNKTVEEWADENGYPICDGYVVINFGI